MNVRFLTPVGAVIKIGRKAYPVPFDIELDLHESYDVIVTQTDRELYGTLDVANVSAYTRVGSIMVDNLNDAVLSEIEKGQVGTFDYKLGNEIPIVRIVLGNRPRG